jgi:hypothetical protein
MDIASNMIFIYKIVERNKRAMSGKEEEGKEWDSHSQIDALEDEIRRTLRRFHEEFDIHPYTMAGLLQLLMIELVEPLVFESDIEEEDLEC